MTTSELEKGVRVKIVGERGTFKVWQTEPNQDGSIILFGGDTDPNGRQSFRNIKPERLVIDKRKRKG